MEVEPPPSPLAAGAVCCMCGDRGLPHELLRCNLCRVRTQHRYCSDLYPRATAYMRCNWCLSEPAQGGGVQPLAGVLASTNKDKRKAAASADEEGGERPQSHHEAGCAATRSRRPAAEVGRPVKKQRAEDRAALPPTSPGAAAKGNSGAKKRKVDERAALPPSPGAAKGNNGTNKHKADELPTSPGAAAKGNNGTNKQKADELPPSPRLTANGDKYDGGRKPMQAGKLARPGRVKVRRYRLLAEVISC